MTLKPQLAGAGEGHRNAADRGAAAVTVDTFVINLCSSTTPMALVQPDTPELKRFRFFISRRLEDGRERFRLHMGYFETLEEAEDWLSVVREVYPGAWAGETPGKHLRARATAPAQPSPAAAPLPPKGAPPGASASPLPSVPAPPAASSDGFAAPASAIANRTSPAASVAPPQVAAAAAPPVRKQIPPAPTVRPHGEAAAGAAPRTARSAPRAPLSNVREVLASLDDGETDGSASTTTTAPTAAGTAHATQSLSDTQVMQLLEARRTEETAREHVSSGIPMLRPDDSGTRRALKEAVQDNAAVSFAVQLQWSEQPMVLDKVPPLAIFSAYTLYTVEGSRDGHKWYGLRLGFFSDATAAKQVAHYVRSDFTAVAVVPVSPQERGRATSADHRTSTTSFAETQPAARREEIQLLDVDRPAIPRTVAAPRGEARTGSAAARAAAARSKTLRSKEPAAQRKGPYSLEETLEILGAGSLEIDKGRGELINESGARHVKAQVRKNSPFQRLVARLTERVRRN